MGKNSRRSLEQMRRDEIGESSNRSPPTLKVGSYLFLKNVLMNMLGKFLKLIHEHLIVQEQMTTKNKTDLS